MRKVVPIPFTKEGLEEKKLEYENLINTRPEAVRELSDARNMGDLSENGLYKAARWKLSGIDATLRRLKNIIKLAQVDESSKKDVVGLGSMVTVSNGKTKLVLHIVGTYESEPKTGKISLNSPIGKSLIGKKVGNVVEVKTPSGGNTFKVISIQ